MKHKEGNSKNEWLFVLPFFIISYMIVYALSLLSRVLVEPLQGTALEFMIPLMKWAEWVSPMYFLMPIVGFFFVFLSIEWAIDFFDSSVLLKSFPIVFIIFCIVSFWVSLLFFNLPNALAGYPINVCFPSCFGHSGNGFIDYWHELKNSAFWLFFLSGLMGWVSFSLKEKFAGIL